jgi:hypothetical protein
MGFLHNALNCVDRKSIFKKENGLGDTSGSSRRIFLEIHVLIGLVVASTVEIFATYSS